MPDPAAAIFAPGAAAGAMNALAGGGPIVVVAALAASGNPADVASLTSTVALLPGLIAFATPLYAWNSNASQFGFNGSYYFVTANVEF